MSDQWYYGQNGQQKGPVSVEVMQQLVAGGHIKPEDLVWKEGMANWVSAGSLPEFFPTGANPTGGRATGTAAQVPGAVPNHATVADYYPQVPADGGAGKATTAMVLGISSIPLCFCPLIGIGLGIAALIVASKVTNAPNQGHATAGKVCGIVGLVLSGLNSISGIIMHFR